MNTPLLVPIICLFLFVSCETKTIQNTQTQTIDLDKGSDSSESTTKTESNDTNITIEAKTPDEVYVEAGLKVGGIVLDKLKEKRKRDSTELANRGKVLVYQIGMPTTDKEVLWNAYQKVKSLPNVYAFTEDKSFYLIKIENYTEQAMQDSLASTVAALAKKGVNERVEILNILKFCNRREIVVQDKKIRIKHHDDIPCYSCN